MRNFRRLRLWANTGMFMVSISAVVIFFRINVSISQLVTSYDKSWASGGVGAQLLRY